MNRQAEILLEIEGLKTHFFTDDGVVRAVDGVSFSVPRGRIVCVVGESGCGKSITARSIMQLVDRPGKIVAGRILYHRTPGDVIDLAALRPNGPAIRAIRGKEISMIFQEPMSSFSPVRTVGSHMIETIRTHQRVSAKEARERAIHYLKLVGLPQPDRRIDRYPFELSGGMLQRAMIATALCCEPSLLIADEPTTALDVTTQAQILSLIQELQARLGMSVIFITHDLGVVAQIADQVVVMYLGRIVEQGDVESIFYDPKHPYTKALLRSIPTIGRRRRRLESIKGSVPHPFNMPTGCPFHPRCEDFMLGVCDRSTPAKTVLPSQHEVHCFLYPHDMETRMKPVDEEVVS